MPCTQITLHRFSTGRLVPTCPFDQATPTANIYLLTCAHRCLADPEADEVLAAVVRSAGWVARQRQQQPRPAGRGAVGSRAPEPLLAPLSSSLAARGFRAAGPVTHARLATSALAAGQEAAAKRQRMPPRTRPPAVNIQRVRLYDYDVGDDVGMQTDADQSDDDLPAGTGYFKAHAAATRQHQDTVEAREQSLRAAVPGHLHIALGLASQEAHERTQWSERRVAGVQQRIVRWSEQPQHYCSPSAPASAANLTGRSIDVKYRSWEASGVLKVCGTV